MQRFVVGLQAYTRANGIPYKLIYSKPKILMHGQSPFSPQISEEQKQLAAHPHEFWTILPPEASVMGSFQSEERAESGKNQSQGEQAPTKGAKKSKRNIDQLKNINRGHWSKEQNKKYHWFLEIHYKHFVNRHMRRTDKIFKTMQIFIGARQAEQCRSHHQKMQKKYLNFISIISNLRQIHYLTQDTEQLKQEIEANGILLVDSLATMQELKAYKRIQDETEPLLLKKQSQVKSPKTTRPHQKTHPVDPQFTVFQVEKPEQHKQRQIDEVGDQINMFEELGNNIGEIGMYQEKEESYLFHSMFQP